MDDNLNVKNNLNVNETNSENENSKSISSSDINDDEFFRSSASITINYDQKHNLINNEVFHPNNDPIPFPTKNKFTKDDFEIIGLLGRGAYAKVVKARIIKSNTIAAIKIINKPFIIKVKLH